MFRLSTLIVLLGSFCILFIMGCSAAIKTTKPATTDDEEKPKIVLGNENLLLNYLSVLKDQRVGLVTNPSGVNSRLQSTADIFHAHPQINLTALFGPEHGIRGAIHAGDHVEDMTDPQTGLPVFSLYGKNRKPTAEMLSKVDVLVIDIQDIGSRSYTYIYTMALVMEAAAEFNKKVVVLDRPNPLGGMMVEGNLVDKGFESFVGLYPIPYRHGLTIGELVLLFNKEFNLNCPLTVIPMLNWKREMFWVDTELSWVPTSPHVPHGWSPLYYCATGTLGELRTVSNGVGYTSPFELVGAPWIDANELADALNTLQLPGIYFRPLHFRPYYFQFIGENCQGVQLHITDPPKCPIYETSLHIMQVINQLYPEQRIFENEERLGMFNKVMGSDWLWQDLRNNIPVSEITQKWQEELQGFLKIRENYLLY